MAFDRNEVLGRTELPELADQLMGPHMGRGTSATWPCPGPGHGTQTGRTPPVSIFRTSYGDERWRCHACGASGTAIDLVMTTQGMRFPEALEVLAHRAGVPAVDRAIPRLRIARIQRPELAPVGRPSADIERFVAAAEAILWSDEGQPMRQWLAGRGLGEEVLRANRVGADPGPNRLDRAFGLPRRGAAIVLPVLGTDGTATYLQSRYLYPKGHKYDNPSATVAGPLPRATEVQVPQGPIDAGVVVVSEGIPDALVAAQAGYRAAAILGAGVPDERAAAALLSRFATERLVIAFDADGPGQTGAKRLQDLLVGLGAEDRIARLELPSLGDDLNSWQQRAGPNFGAELRGAMERSEGMAYAMAADSARTSRELVGTPTIVEPEVAEEDPTRTPEVAATQSERSQPERQAVADNERETTESASERGSTAELDCTSFHEQADLERAQQWARDHGLGPPHSLEPVGLDSLTIDL